MSQEGIDAAVFKFLEINNDIGLVGAILPSMSSDGAEKVAEKYYNEKTSNGYDWIFSPYKK